VYAIDYPAGRIQLPIQEVISQVETSSYFVVPRILISEAQVKC